MLYTSLLIFAMLGQLNPTEPPRCWNEQGIVFIELRLQNNSGRMLDLGLLSVDVFGHLSNSRIPGHGRAAKAFHRMTLDEPKDIAEIMKDCTETTRLNPTEQKSWQTNEILKIRVNIAHEHGIWGELNPLLGQRNVRIKCEDYVLETVLSLKYSDRMPPILLKFADDRYSTEVFRSAPNSITLQSHVPGNQYLRSAEFKVRGSAKYRLRFYVLIAKNSYTEFRVCLKQYRDSPTSWQNISDLYEETFTKEGIWIKVDKIVTTNKEANSMAIDFRLNPKIDELSEAWIDDLSIEEMGQKLQTGP